MVDFILRPEPGVEKKALDIGWSPCLLSLMNLIHLGPSDFQGVEVVSGKRLRPVTLIQFSYLSQDYGHGQQIPAC